MLKPVNNALMDISIANIITLVNRMVFFQTWLIITVAKFRSLNQINAQSARKDITSPKKIPVLNVSMIFNKDAVSVILISRTFVYYALQIII